jgi:hypothetical protein
MSSSKPALRSRVIIADEFATADQRGVIYLVTRHYKVNVLIKPENPDGPAGGSINPLLLRPVPPAETRQAQPVAAHATEHLPPLAHGTVVTIDHPTWAQPRQWLWVVLGKSTGRRPDRYRIARLGGLSGDDYYRVHRSIMTVVDPQRVTVGAPV